MWTGDQWHADINLCVQIKILFKIQFFLGFKALVTLQKVLPVQFFFFFTPLFVTLHFPPFHWHVFLTCLPVECINSFPSFFPFNCWTISTHSNCCPILLSFPSSPVLVLLFLFSLPVCGSIPFSLFCSHRQQRQRPGAVHGAPPAGGAGPAAGSDQVHQEGTAVVVSRL